MTIHEYGKENKDVIVLVHPSVVRWDYFEYVIPLLEMKYHLIIPALPGYDIDEKEDFTNVERIAEGIAKWLIQNKYNEVSVVYGCSMGGSIVMRMVIDKKVQIQCAVIDGGITPYQLPWILTRFILLRDFSMMMIGKLGGEKLLTKVFTTDEYTEDDMKYVADVLKHCSVKTLWNTFDSCNNFRMPETMPDIEGKMYYWYAQNEKKERKWDITYVRNNFSTCKLVEIPSIGHGGLATLKPEIFVEILKQCMAKETI